MKLYALAAALTTAEAFTTTSYHHHNGAACSIHSRFSTTKLGMTDEIISPFDNNSEDGSDGSVSTATFTPLPSDDEPLDLTWENVDLVLEEMRPYLIQDGGNVAISEIDGPIVRLELQGACGTCPSSTQTMKMGLERKLLERIPEIQEVIQAMPESPDLNDEQINIVLDSVRPFLQVAGGTIDVDSITGEGGIQPTITLRWRVVRRR